MGKALADAMPTRLLLILMVALALAPSASSEEPPLTIGIQGILGSQYADTFGPYLSNSTPYTFKTILYTNDTLMQEDARAGKLNMTFAGPVQYLCLSLAATTSDGVAELVSSSYVDGSPVERLAGAIVVNANSRIAQVRDLVGASILTGPLSSLTAFAAQWRTIEDAGLDLFRDAAGVFLNPNISNILPDLQNGVGDVAFVPSSYLERYYPNTSSFRVVGNAMVPGFPYAHSTPLYPNALISALDTTSFEIRKAVAMALFNISPASSLAQSGMFFGFSPLGAYTVVRTLMASVGLLNASTQCRTIQGLTDLITCPDGFQRKPTDVTCIRQACPQGYSCVCNPCTPILRADSIIGLSVTAFALVAAAVVCFGALFTFLTVRVCYLRTLPDPIHEMELEVATVIGRSTTGPVLATKWQGQQVAVKRLFSPPQEVRSVFDEEAWMGCSQSPFLKARVILSLIQESMWIPTPNTRYLARIRRRMALHHGNIIPILGVSRGEYGQEAIAIMPRMEAGTIADLLASQTYVIDTLATISIASDIANAQHFFHSCEPPVIGKNIKPHHLFLDDSLRTLIGISFRPPNTQSLWAPPEVLRGETPWTQAADVYAFSMLLYTLLHRHPPFKGRKSAELLGAIADADEDTMLDARPPVRGDSPLHELMRRCWAQHPLNRPSFADIKANLAQMRGTGKGPRPSFSVNNSTDLASFMGPQRDPGLLEGMFPPHVLRLLKAGLPVPPEKFSDVTIFFSDVVGFTSLSSILPPEQVQNLLDRLYTPLDLLTDKWQVHKMETIGDGLVAVTNLMHPQPDHAPRMARFALDVAETASAVLVDESKPAGAKLQLRIGLHSGEVVAGVAGSKNVRYCLFGHTMNIASRMESEGEPGRIHMSRVTAGLIKEDPLLEPRVQARPGMVDVKGQGNMKTAWLLNDAEMRTREPASMRSRRQSFIASLPDPPRFNVDGANVVLEMKSAGESS